jgi:MFS family permease
MIKRGGGGRGSDVAVCAADVEAGAPDGGGALVALEGAALMRNVLPAVLVAALGAFSFGYHLGVVNPALEHLARDLGIAANVQMKGLVVSTVLIGATVGSLVSGKVADDLGRKAALVVFAAPLVFGSLLCSCAPAVWVMLLGRVLAGLGIGGLVQVDP